MPIYEYACQSCGERVEVLQRISDPPPAACPNDAGELVRVLSAHNVTGGGAPGASARSMTPEPSGMSCGTCGMAGPGCS